MIWDCHYAKYSLDQVIPMWFPMLRNLQAGDLTAPPGRRHTRQKAQDWSPEKLAGFGTKDKTTKYTHTYT